MTLTPCRRCGQQVSTEAPACPHCGVPDPVESIPSEERATKRTESGSLFGAFLLAVGLLWALLGVGNWGSVSLVLNMLLFILPGLTVAALGQMLRKRAG
jgi:ribosomal protein L37E